MLGEVTLYIMMSPDKLKESCVTNCDLYFDGVSSWMLWGTVILQEKRKLFSQICHVDSEGPL